MYVYVCSMYSVSVSYEQCSDYAEQLERMMCQICNAEVYNIERKIMTKRTDKQQKSDKYS